MAIILDTETTGLLKPNLAANAMQPQIIELYAARFNEETYEITGEFESFVRPVEKWGETILLEDPVRNLKHISRITNIYDYMLSDAPTFSEIAEEFYEFCKDETLVVGQNVMFDYEILKHNYIRVEKSEMFHEFPKKACTVELSYPIRKKRLKLGDLYKICTGQVLEDAHRAKNDVLATLTCYKWLLENGF